MRVRLYKRTKDNLSYFQFLSDDDQPILNSQGYADKEARNNGVRSVVTNAGDANRYERQTSEDGKNFFILKAGNNQEIARSVKYDSADAMEAAIAESIAKIPSIASGGGGSKAAAPAAAEPTTTDATYKGEGGDDNYKPLAFYQERIKGEENGFDTFATDDGGFYFTLNQNGNIVLISEAYTSQNGRNNGTTSVTKNLPIDARYRRKVHANGKHYFDLLAGNNQEIATSVWFDSEADMNTAINALQRGLFGGTAEKVMKEAGQGGDGLEGMEGYRAAVEITPAAPAAKDEEPKPKKKRKKVKREPKGEKVMLKKGTYLFNDVSSQTMKSANDKYYFSFRTAEDKALLISTNIRGYNTEDEVDAAVARVLEFGPYEGNYEGKTTKNGKFYFYLNDTDGNRVAKSFFYDTPEDMQDGIGLLIGRGIVAAEAAPKAPEAAPAATDDYLPCERYKGEAGFHKFFNGEDENWYFAWNDSNGNTILRSEGYQSEKARDNGIESVKKNSPIEARWNKIEEDGKYYWTLKAGNHQEIGRSCPYESEDAALGAVRGAAGALWVPPPPPPKPARIVDDYLPCEAYTGGAGFHKFDKDGEWYFAWNDSNGNTILRSEGYQSEKARDNGIESVKKNSPIEARWNKIEEDGKYYWTLKAVNHQEIGRSCPYDNEDAALGAVRGAAGALWVPPPPPPPKPARIVDDYLPCEAYTGGAGFHKFDKDGEWYFAWNDANGNTILRSEGYQSEKARDNGIESVKKNSPIEARWNKIEEDGKYYWTLKAGNHQEIGRSCPYESEDAALGAVRGAAGALWVPPPPPPKPARIVDDYLPCEAYTGGAGFHKFDKDGEWYFAWNDSNGNTILRSEGYQSEKARDNGIESVKKNSPIEARWNKIEEDGKYYWTLKAGNHQEIGRSCPYDSEDAALGAVRGAAGALWVPPPPPPPKPARIVDDYLPCEAYAGADGFHRFKKDRELYFGYNDKDGNTILRSEGYKSEKARENGIKSVKKNSKIKERWVKAKTDDGRYYYSLKAGNNQEIARSCYQEDEGAMLAMWGLLPGLFMAAAVVPKVAPPPPPPAPKPKPKPKPVPVAAVATAAAATAAAAAATAVPPPPAKGRFPWWLLLLGLLALLALLWFCRGCFGCEATPPPPPPPPVEVPVPDPEPAPEPEPAPPPPAPVCACNGSDIAMFNLPSGKKPKSLKRLGTYPEFGDSHSLDAAGFFNKLKNAYSSNGRDKRFLDNLYRGMGYENGFADANADQFSSISIPVGTVGNMGYGKRHKTTYARLDVTSERDTRAFHIQAANGCHMNFMKTCGNHFFFCPN